MSGADSQGYLRDSESVYVNNQDGFEASFEGTLHSLPLVLPIYHVLALVFTPLLLSHSYYSNDSRLFCRYGTLLTFRQEPTIDYI